MSPNYARLFRVLFVIILVKLSFLLILYWRSYGGAISNLDAPQTQWQSESESEVQSRHMVNVYDQLLVDRRAMPSLEQRLHWIRQEMPAFPLEELLQRERRLKRQRRQRRLERQRLQREEVGERLQKEEGGESLQKEEGVDRLQSEEGGEGVEGKERRPKRRQRRPPCAPAPDLMNIDFHNTYWQRAQSENLTYYIYGAYYDDREAVPGAPLVRLLAMINQHDDERFQYPATHCQLWMKGRGKPLTVPVTKHQVLWPFGHAPRRYYPTLMDCRMPEGRRYRWDVPQMVSLVGEPCERARNLLRVVYEEREDVEETGYGSTEQEPPLRFAVCVKAMDFPYEDKSWRLIEWLELMRSLGAHKVVFYDAQMHPNMTRVVRDYVQQSPGFVELRPMSLGRGEPHATPHFQHFAMQADGFNRILNEMIPYNDCFYRNMYRYDYIGVFDIDEVIMPLGNRTNWSQLIEISRAAPDYGSRTPANCTEWVSFCYRNVYYPRYAERPRVYGNLSNAFYMLQHVARVRQHCKRNTATKCLHDTRFAVGLHNHMAFYHTEAASCEAKSVPIEYAQMQHYREPDTKSLLLDPVIDASIWRYQPQLQARIEERYRRLGFVPNERQLEESLKRRRLNDEALLRAAVAENSQAELA